MRTRVKICGITREKDAVSAIEQGVDALGFVFYEPSPRYVDIKKAIEISNFVPPFVSIVGLFVDAENSFITRVLENVRIDSLQFHGNENAETCMQYNRPWIKAIKVGPDLNLEKVASSYNNARGLLFDTFNPDLHGGTGTTFDWSVIPPDIAKRSILAGGLNVQNVSEAIKTVKPFAVDVSGGVESSPGIKDSKKIARFMDAVSSGENI